MSEGAKLLLIVFTMVFTENYVLVQFVAICPFLGVSQKFDSCVGMMVNGNIGAGVAVAGAFSLVRFRSAPGTAREIAALFLAMATGLITGMGYIGYAAIFVVVIGTVMCLLTQSSFGEKTGSAPHKTLRITIPEDLDYAGVFDDLFEQYTSNWRLQSVKTSNMYATSDEPTLPREPTR